MLTAYQIVERIRAIRELQPSAIRSSILMAILQLSCFLCSFLLMGTSIYIYAESGNVHPKRHGQVELYAGEIKSMFHLRSEDSVDQAYFLLVISLLLLLVWKLTKMVRNRNRYILILNEILDDEKNEQ